MRINSVVKVALHLIVVTNLYCCSPHYGPAIWGNNFPYMTKPVYHDTNCAANYISGIINSGIVYNDNESNFLAQGQLHRSHTHENNSFSYGVYGYHGRYNVSKDITINCGEKYYSGFGIKGGTNTIVSTKHLELNPIGVQTVVYSEFGEYMNFLSDAKEIDSIYLMPTSNHKIKQSICLNSGINYKLKKNSILGIQLGIAFPVLYESNDGWLIYYFPINLHYTNKHFSFAINGNYPPFAGGLSVSYRINSRNITNTK